MAFYWVFQNSTYKEESKGGYLWAPKKGKRDRVPFHWKTMNDLQEGDIVFSSCKQKIVAISTILSKAYSHKKPFEINSETEWQEDGNKVDLNFHTLNESIPLNSFSPDLKQLLSISHGPLNSNGTGNQGYLFKVQDKAANKLLSIIENKNNLNIEVDFLNDIEKQKIDKTTKKSIIESRIGQGIFRKNLINFWEGKCAITSIELTDILIASHIKPWKISNNNERLDLFNGLLLSPTYDKLFDSGYISFDLSGEIIISSKLTSMQIKQLNLNNTNKLTKKLNIEFEKYLSFHKENIFIA